MASDYDEFKPHQKLISDADRMENFKKVIDMKEQMNDEFNDKTMVNGIRDKVSLFALAVKQ